MQPADFDKVLAWENDPENWRVSHTTEPFSKEAIQQFVITPQDIYSSGQLRLIVCRRDTNAAIGAVDLFEFDGMNQSAGVGVLIEPTERNQGYALESLELLANYALNEVGIRALFANIHNDNTASIRLFEKAGFQKADRKSNTAEDTGKWLNTAFYRKDLAI